STDRARGRRPRTSSAGAQTAESFVRAIKAGFLSLVALDDLGIADARSIWVLAGLAEGAPLTQEVPRLVERDLDRLEPVVLVRVQASLAHALVELLFLGDELLD